jgi:hypothetical protein
MLKSFNPPAASTPTEIKIASMSGVTRRFETTGLPMRTPVRTQADAYRSSQSTPATSFKIIPNTFDPRSIERLPSLNDLMHTRSEIKKRDRKEALKKKRLAALSASQSMCSRVGSQSLGLGDSSAIVASQYNSPQVPSPPLTPVDKDSPTVTAKRRMFDWVLSLGSLGGGAFSSQYDVESSVSDISRFMQDDVDDIFA